MASPFLLYQFGCSVILGMAILIKIKPSCCEILLLLQSGLDLNKRYTIPVYADSGSDCNRITWIGCLGVQVCLQTVMSGLDCLVKIEQTNCHPVTIRNAFNSKEMRKKKKKKTQTQIHVKIEQTNCMDFGLVNIVSSRVLMKR